MSPARPFLALIATALVGTLGHAAAPKRLVLGDLPQAALPALPALDQRPASVAAGSSVKGVRVSGDAGGMARLEQQQRSMRRHSRGKMMSPPPVTPGMVQVQVTGEGEDGACVAVLMQGRDVFRTTPMFVDGSEGVLPIRVESLKEGDAPVLSIVDVWVDPTTQGAREIRRVDVPLKKVATGPLDAPAYAFRDGNVVHVVVPAGNNAQMSNADGGLTPSSCGVARGELSTERGKGATLSGFFTRQTPAVEAKDGFAAVAPMSFRVALAASASQTSRDPEPVLSFVVRTMDAIPDMPRQRVATNELTLDFTQNWAFDGRFGQARSTPMTQELAPYLTNATRGEVRLVPESGTASLRGAAAAASLLFVEVPPLGPSARGQLGEFLEAAVEDALVRRGAAPPGVGASSDWDASLSDQLYRARHVGVRGVVVALGSLQGMAGGGVLDPDDSAALAFWASATRERPVVLLVDAADRAVAGYRAPVRLDELLALDALVEPSATSEPPVVAERVLEEPAPVPARAAAKPIDEGAWRRDAAELSAAKGPKPLALVERLFVSRYVPLVDAVDRGTADANARDVRAEWARSFAKSYAEAFAALRVTGKRPMMVFDLPQAAGRLARLHGARSVELLLVDSMRFDLGLRVHERLRDALEGKAACAERLLLWSAIPSTTATQLDLLAHGLEALSRPLAEDGDAGVARGRSVTSLRRMKVGARDLLKLDVVESRLRDPGAPVAQRLDAIADEVAPVVARHAASLPERTLLVVFGDHGFCLDGDAHGSGSATQGGASPEEVLVPAYAWLVGGVH